jgi:dTDP-4-dehydrorhamnose reductase
MHLLVTGANGQVGRELQRQGLLRGWRTSGLDRTALDITERDAVLRTVRKIGPDLVINAAAYTAVDRAEEEPDAAFAVNRDGPAWLAEACAGLGIALIHLSTDYVFDGRADRPYPETAPVAPLGVYGQSKAAGEEEVRSRLGEHLIVRTSWVYGSHGRNFVNTMLRLGKEKEVLRVVNDQQGCPTFARDLAAALLAMAEKIKAGPARCWGTYHCCGATAVTWHAFATLIFTLAGKKHPVKVKHIIPISSSEYPMQARRPQYSVLDCSKVAKFFGIRLPQLPDSLAAFLAAQG